MSQLVLASEIAYVTSDLLMGLMTSLEYLSCFKNLQNIKAYNEYHSLMDRVVCFKR